MEVRDRAESEQGQSRGSVDSANPKEPTPSSSRPPPPHPILKKPRGPSTSGSRPTARFALPPDSSDEDGRQEPSSQGTASDMPPPPRPTSYKGEKKAAVATTKKFVASTAASKRRPVLPRRQSSQSSDAGYAPPVGKQPAPQRSSSQSSTGSSSQVEGPVGGSHARRGPRQHYARQQAKGSSRRSAEEPAANIHQGRVRGENTPAITQAEENASTEALAQPRPQTTLATLPEPTPSATQKQPIVTQRVHGFLPKRGPGVVSPAQSEGAPVPERPMSIEASQTLVLQSRRPVTAQPLDFIPPSRPVAPQQSPGATSSSGGRYSGNLLSYELNKSYSATNRPPAPIAGFVADRRSPILPPDSHTNVDAPERRSSVGGLQPPQAVSSVVGTTTTTAKGQFDSDTVPIPVLPEASSATEHTSFGSQSKSPSLLNMQFTPTQPNPAPPVPFGRSKSQLKLVLEREKERGHDIRPSRFSGGGRRKGGEQSNK
ncbi:hypothetical protein GQ53DRAFT_441340 [Thozetella sp. PMI_491]|nr:hypothetical protein GQ53DRAFT_441340 [Thozetella sp. PMI_491]